MDSAVDGAALHDTANITLPRRKGRVSDLRRDATVITIAAGQRPLVTLHLPAR